MKFYLKVINPIVSIIIFVFCLIAATTDDGDFTLMAIFTGSFSSYFFAKGLFTSLLLFVNGHILLKSLDFEPEKRVKYKKREIISIITIGVVLINLLFLPVYISNFSSEDEEDESIELVDPENVVISKYYRISETENLKIGGEIVNKGTKDYSSIVISADVYSNDNYIQSITETIFDFTGGKKENFIIKSDDILNELITNEIDVTFTITAYE